jgi:predicted permease
VDALVQDFKLAARRLLKDRGFAIATIATLALCLAANAAIFSVVNVVVLRPLPYPEPERLVTMFNAYPGAGSTRGQNAIPDYFDRLHETNVFEELALYTWTNVTIGGQGQSDPERILGMTVTPSFFQVLRVQPFEGRLFGDSDAEVGQQRQVILSHGLWQRLFPGRTDLANADLLVNGQPYAVIGVMPSSFQFDPDSQLWMPAAFSPEDRADARRHSNNWQMFGRLKPGATLRQAQAQIDALNLRNLDRFPEMKQVLINAGFHTPVFLWQDDLVRETRPIMLLLWGGVLLVLMIGCVNVANLASVRATARSREIATRLSLGTTMGGLARQMVVESLLLSAIGGAIGLLFATGMLHGIQTLGLDALRGKDISLNWQTLAYTFLLVAVTGGVVGAWPVAGLRQGSLADILREEGRSGTSTRHARTMRRGLVTSQVAFALVLLMAAGLLLASFERVLAIDLGFRSEHVLTGDLTLPASRYPGQPNTASPGAAPSSVGAASDRILMEVRQLPGVTAAGATSSIPFGRIYSDSVILPDNYRPAPGHSLLSPSQVRVSEGYLEAMGAALAAGRFFEARDTEGAPRAAMVDESLARRFWPGTNPIGRRLYFPRGVETGLAPPPEDEWFSVVGVIKDMQLQGIATNTGSGVFGTYFLPFRQFPLRAFTMAISTEGDPVVLAPSVRAAVARIDPELPFYDVRPMQALVERALVDRRTPMLLASGFAIVALILCAIGIYGVLSFEVRLRTREIAIRMALGADRASILRLVFNEAAMVVTAGAAIGMAAAFLLRRAIESQLYEIRLMDPLVVSVVSAVLVLAAALSCALPARRALAMNPSVALSDQ